MTLLVNSVIQVEKTEEKERASGGLVRRRLTRYKVLMLCSRRDIYPAQVVVDSTQLGLGLCPSASDTLGDPGSRMLDSERG